MEVNIEHRITDVEARAKSNTKRIDELEKRQDDLDDLVTTIKKKETRDGAVESGEKEITRHDKKFNSKSGVLWEKKKKKIVWAIAAAVLAFLSARIGL